MQAVILVGGQGTRLRPLTLTTPKPLVPLANRPTLAHILRWLAAGGVEEVILAMQYAAAAFEPFLRHWHGLPVRAIQEPVPLGTAGAVRNIRAQLHGPTVIVNGDNLTDLDLQALWQSHTASGAQATIAVGEVADPSGCGVVVSDATGRVSCFQEKPAAGLALANTINTGTYLIDPAVLDHLVQGEVAMWETDLFPALIAADVPVFAATLPHQWVDVGTPRGYFRGQAALLAGLLGTPPGTMLQAGQWAEAQVSLAADAIVTGPLTLGFGAIIAAGARLTGPLMLGRETHVFAGATITRSALWDGCMIEHGATISDSILGYNCYVGAGVQLQGALVGDGAVIQAGTTLPAGAIVAPGTVFNVATQPAG
ncbi:MAG: NDP-sugar synthase [Herpetosiphonaceae bacterium]|nr:NDP-sugar synthase [Herpetosiphonaceae bacterium]